MKKGGLGSLRVRFGIKRGGSVTSISLLVLLVHVPGKDTLIFATPHTARAVKGT